MANTFYTTSAIAPPASTSPSGDCGHWVRLATERTDPAAGVDALGYFARVWIEEYGGGVADGGIFVYQSEPAVPETGDTPSFFSAVAVPQDLEELPLESPLYAEIVAEASSSSSSSSSTTDAEIPVLFRLDYVEAYFRTEREMTAFVDAVTGDVQILMAALRRRCEHLADPQYETISG